MSSTALTAGPAPNRSGPGALRRPVRADIEWLMDAADSWWVTRAWDLRDRWGTPATITALLWSDAAAATWVLDAPGAGPVGLVQIVDVDPVNRHAMIELVLQPGWQETCGPMCRDVAARALSRHRLRKLCLSASEDRLVPSEVLGPRVAEVGRWFAHHRRSRDRYVDVVLYELGGTTWVR